MARSMFVCGIILGSLTLALAAPREGRCAEDANVLAWQRADRYVAPDFPGYFADDLSAGQELDAVYQGGTYKQLPAEELLKLVRRGLRRSSNSKNMSRTAILSHVGKSFIWNVAEQNPQAIELMYHAAACTEFPDVAESGQYYGTTVVNRRSDNLVRSLMEQYWRVGTQIRERIDWGFKTYGDKADTAARLQKLLDQRDSLSDDTVLAAYYAFQNLTGKSPAHPERYADLGDIVVAFHPPTRQATEQLRAFLVEEAKLETRLIDFTSRVVGVDNVAVALVRGVATRDKLVQALEARKYVVDFVTPLTVTLLGERRLSEFAKYLRDPPAQQKLPRHEPDYEPADETYAWNRTDQFVAADFESFFPDDEQAGAELDRLFAARENLTLSDQKILDLVRRGLRRSHVDASAFSSWFTYAFHFTWPTNPAAVEIMYHLTDRPAQEGVKFYLDGEYSAVYYCLSGVSDKPENILRTFAHLYFSAEHDQRGRMIWSLRTPREKEFFAERLAERLDNWQTLPVEQLVAAFDDYRQLTGAPVPRAERFDNTGLFLCIFRHPQGRTMTTLAEHVQQNLAGPGFAAEFIPFMPPKARPDDPQYAAVFRGLAGRDTLIARLQQAKYAVDFLGLLTPELVENEAFVPLKKFLPAEPAK